MFSGTGSEGESEEHRGQERPETAAKKSVEEIEDLQEKKIALQEEARGLAQGGEAFHEVLREANRQELLRFKQGGLYDHVQIVAEGCCEECDNRDGEVMPLEEALRKEPLPQAGCRRFIDSDVYTEGWCVCSWTFEDSEGATGEKLPT